MPLILQNSFCFVVLPVAGDFSSDQLLQKGRRVQRTSSKDIHALPLVPNPIVCLEAGDTILFQLSINSHSECCLGLCALCRYMCLDPFRAMTSHLVVLHV